MRATRRQSPVTCSSPHLQAMTPKVAVTPVIAMGGSYATANFHAAAKFTEVMVAEAVKWNWDGL